MTARARHLYRFGPFRLDATDRLFYREDELVALPPKVFDTLLLLVANSDQILAKDEMIKQLWPDTFVEEGTLAQYISLLRKALGDGAAWIENHPRRGYRFTAAVEEINIPSVEPGIEEQSQSRVVIDRQEVAVRSRFVRHRTLSAGLALAGLITATLIWASRSEKVPASFGSVAVLPFRAMSGSGDEYLADGITEALITRLANLSGLRVVSYSQVRRFKGSSEDAVAIGRQIGVEAVIEGTVRRTSERLRISVHAVDAKTGYTIWALDRLEAKAEKLLDIEGQLAEAAAQRVRGVMTANERDLVTKSRASNTEAYELVLRARGANLDAASEMLHRAIQLDPGFADAYGWLALTQVRAYSQWLGGAETLRKAISNANLALSKDPNASVAIRALTNIHHQSGRNVEGLLLSRRALERSPDDLDAIAAAAESHFWNGLYDRAIPLYHKALAGEPASIEFRTQLGRLHLYLGQIKEGIDIISPLRVSEAGLFGALLYAEGGQMAKAAEIARGDQRKPYGFDAYIRGYVLAAAGDHAGAKQIWTDGLRIGEGLLAKNENRHSIINGLLCAKLGKREEALRNIEESMAANAQHPMSLFFAAQIRALLGLRREALDTLNVAIEKGFFNLPMIEFHSRPGLAFHILRDHPEFHTIRAGLGARIDLLRERY